jgi:uncharacterized protein YggU (UPF0235/DUF167 family)
MPPSSITILRGVTGREKLLRLAGLTAAAVRTRLQGIEDR